jgi:hypothetical protein
MAIYSDIGYKKLIVSSDQEFIGDFLIYEKIARKKQGSKAFKRALTERNNTINQLCNQLNLSGIKALYAEDLKNVKHKSKGKIIKNSTINLRGGHIQKFWKNSPCCVKSREFFLPKFLLDTRVSDVASADA